MLKTEEENASYSIGLLESAHAMAKAGRIHSRNAQVSINQTREALTKSRSRIHDTDEKIARWWFRPEHLHS